MAPYSIIIRNGHVLDGKKNPLQRVDIGIAEDRIKKIGDLSLESADKEVDARGKYIAPGFIDITNHSDTYWTLFDSPRQESLLWQGVTTIVGGNCGTSLAPLVTGKEIDALQKWTDTTSINVNWQSTKEFFEEMSRHAYSVNFCTLVGFGTLRRGVVQNINAPASTGELEKMKYLLQEALHEGAFGLSTSLGRSHEQLAGKSELGMLARTLSDANALIKHHIRDEGEGILPSISEVLSVARGAHTTNAAAEQGTLRTHISHFKILGKKSWASFDEAVNMLEQAQRDGISLTIDIFPYTRTNSNLYFLLPSWAREGGKDAMLLRLTDPPARKQIISDIQALTLHYDRIVVASTFRDTTALGKTIQELSDDTGLSPEEVILNLLHINNLQVSIFNEVIAPEHIVQLMEKPYTAVSTDGIGIHVAGQLTHKIPHPRSFGSFPKIFNELVKEKSLLSWEDAVYRMTGLPARIIGLSGRGIVEEGAFADIVVFDPEKIMSHAQYANPLRYAEGVEWVCVNGIPVIHEKNMSKNTPGRVLRKGSM